LHILPYDNEHQPFSETSLLAVYTFCGCVWGKDFTGFSSRQGK